VPGYGGQSQQPLGDARAWPIGPAAAGERQIGTGLVTGDAAAIDALLLDEGFTGRRFAAEMSGAGIDVVIPGVSENLCEGVINKRQCRRSRG
jgi:hypothetical protein